MHPRPTLAVLSLASSIAFANTCLAADPFMGDWEGDGVVAQVIPLGGSDYRINFLPEFDVKCEPLAVVEAKSTGNKLQFNQDGWSGAFEAEEFRGYRPGDGKSIPTKLKKVVRLSPTVGANPPAEAVVLFDGSGFDHWQVHRSRLPATDIVWKIIKDSMQVTPINKDSRAGHSIATRKAFQDFRLHLEFRLPLMAAERGQKRSNGGLAFEDYSWYEVQILDSYGLEGRDNECGGIYKVAAPRVNMCRPPLQWQTYDIEYHAPRYDESGTRTRAGRISVTHNGVEIHKDVELPDSPNAEKKRKANPGSATVGRLILHYHKDPIQYRNIWLQRLE